MVNGGESYNLKLAAKTDLIKNKEYKQLKINCILSNNNKSRIATYKENEFYAELYVNGKRVDRHIKGIDFTNNENESIFTTTLEYKAIKEILNFNIMALLVFNSKDKKLMNTNTNIIVSI